jgi:hypothetical protein
LTRPDAAGPLLERSGAWYDHVVDEQAPQSDPDDDYEFPLPPPPEAQPQVPAYIALIRIIAVLGMGLCMSFGLFISLVGVSGLIVGIPIFLMAIPLYLGMRFAERLAMRHAEAAGEV